MQPLLWRDCFLCLISFFFLFSPLPVRSENPMHILIFPLQQHKLRGTSCLCATFTSPGLILICLSTAVMVTITGLSRPLFAVLDPPRPSPHYLLTSQVHNKNPYISSPLSVRRGVREVLYGSGSSGVNSNEAIYVNLPGSRESMCESVRILSKSALCVADNRNRKVSECE